ncbi:MAG: aminotransferase class I/II-fold pyridoxal phosphate-dependent enzyme, partial [Candidatus Omnitrophica bacterium]|nr:aminotransferase class I/II-fold pyridoxal phosphate-dependent enzyme [Candidatus Omnitrophota bacterium]
EFQKRREYIIGRLKDIKKMSFIIPEGAFYVFCDISKTGLDSLAFSGRLLDEELVAVIPGQGFGRDDCVRLSFATGIEQIEKGMDRIKEWVAKL